MSMLVGGIAGLALAAFASWLLYRGLLKIPAGRFFGVTNGLLSLLAAGMGGQAVVHLVNAGVLLSLGDQWWDTSSVLPDDTLVGRALHALIGYSDRPMGAQVIVYVLILTALLMLQAVPPGRTRGPSSSTAARP